MRRVRADGVREAARRVLRRLGVRARVAAGDLAVRGARRAGVQRAPVAVARPRVVRRQSVPGVRERDEPERRRRGQRLARRRRRDQLRQERRLVLLRGRLAERPALRPVGAPRSGPVLRELRLAERDGRDVHVRAVLVHARERRRALRFSTDSTGTTTWSGGTCCASGTLCSCYNDLDSCSTSDTTVAQCDVSTIGCGASQVQVGSCSF